MIYTAQYKYAGEDRIDVTVKSSQPPWRYFAPSWDMVRNYKNGNYNEEAYTSRYMNILKYNMEKRADLIIALAEQLAGRTVTFVCFCRPGAFCHRVLLAEWFQREFGVPYMGER